MQPEATEQRHALFWGMLKAQTALLLVVALFAGIIGGVELAMAAAWGAAISVIAYAWAGFQLWMHPGNRTVRRQATAAFRAEIGKVIIMLLLFWLSFKEMPQLQHKAMAAALFAGFFFAQLSGWIWLARKTGGPGEISQAKTDDD